MKILKQTGVFSLLLMMIISSLGMSFYLHNCSCSGDTTISLGTGFSDHKMISCCSSCNTVSGKNTQEPAFSKQGCCKDRLYIYLLPVAPDHVVQYVSPVTGNFLFNVFTAFVANNEPSALVGSFSLIHDPPIQRSGKLLVYFIRQIKIPFPAI